MVREAWWATVHGIAKELDTTKQLTHTYITKLPYRNVPNTFLLFLFVLHFGCVVRGIPVPCTGVRLVPPAVKAQSPNHWTAREVPSEIYQVLLHWHPAPFSSPYI